MSENKKQFDFTFRGTVVEVMETQTFGSGFKKRTFVVDNAPKDKEWKNPVPFVFTKDDVKKLDGIQKGMEVEISGWFNGRKWEGQKGVSYFCDNTVYGNVKIISSVDVDQPAATKEEEPEIDDMPF